MSKSPVKHQAKEHESLLERLAHLGETLGTARDYLTLWRALCKFAEDSVPCIGIFISLYDPVSDERTAVYACGDGIEADVSELPPMPVGEAEGPNSQAVRTRQVIVTNDYWNKRTKGKGHLSVIVGPDNGLRPQSSLVVPMLTMGRVVGTVEVQSYEDEAYGEEHVTPMRVAANLAAVAVENMRLFERESRARATAEEANRLKDEFLATLSHELRTPLTAIFGWTSLLRAGNLDEETARRALEIIERNAQAQRQIIEDILDVSHIVAGKFRFEPQPVELSQAVRAAVDLVRPTAALKRIEIEESYEAGACALMGDFNRLQQIFWNLLTNAIKFTQQGGRVRVSTERAGAGRARVRVADTGAGVEPSFLPYVFDRFRQGDQSTTRSFGGLGLGLSIVRHLVELHGGEARAESEGAGRGATFTIELPLTETHKDADDGEAHKRLAASKTSPGVLEGLRVLVVDDDEDALDLVATTLRRDGAEVLTATNAREALELFAASKPSVLLSDIGMPQEDGYELIEKMRRIERETNSRPTPAVALTAYASETDRTRALGAGYQIHLPKPVEPSGLAQIVKSLAEKNEPLIQ